MKNLLYRLCQFVFAITLIVFVGMGFVVVFTQLFGIAASNSALVKSIAAKYKDLSTYISSICVLFAYFAYYLKPAKK